MINGFALATGDQQWIHVDAVLAEKESPLVALLSTVFGCCHCLVSDALTRPRLQRLYYWFSITDWTKYVGCHQLSREAECATG